MKKIINRRRLLLVNLLLTLGCMSLLSFSASAEVTLIKKASPPSAQNASIGRVVKYIRTAVLIDKPEGQGVQIKHRGERLFSGNELHTGSKSKAYIKMGDGSKILLRQHSKLRVINKHNVKVRRGKVMFSVAKRKKHQSPFQVATRVALLGIRGTQFVVEAGDDEKTYNVYLKEGSIVAYPNKKQFKLHKDKEKQEFADYVNAQKSEFEKMNAQQQQEFSEYVEEITMKKNKGLSFTGNDVKEVEIPEEVKAWFNEFDDPDIGW